MALPLLNSAQEAEVKKEEADDYETDQTPSNPSNQSVIPSGAALPSIDAEVKEETTEDNPIKQEPTEEEVADHRPQLSVSPLDTASAALLALAATVRRKPNSGRPLLQPSLAFLGRDDKNGMGLLELPKPPTYQRLPQETGRGKASMAARSSNGDARSTLYSRHLDILAGEPPKRGRPALKRYSVEEQVLDPKTRRQANNRVAAFRYREKKKAVNKDLKCEQNVLTSRNDELKDMVEELEDRVQIWRDRFRQTFRFVPEMPAELDLTTILPTSSEASTSDVSLTSDETRRSCRASQNRAAALKFREKKKEVSMNLQKEHDHLTSLNSVLRTHAIDIAAEIQTLRAKMGFGHVKTSADQPLPEPTA